MPSSRSARSSSKVRRFPGPSGRSSGYPRADRRNASGVFSTLPIFPPPLLRARLYRLSLLSNLRLTLSRLSRERARTRHRPNDSANADEANALLAKGFPVKAAAAFDQALKLVSPNDPRAGEMHRERAACFFYAKQFADVVVEATRALKSRPADPTALLYRAKAYQTLGQGKKAKADAIAAAAVEAEDDVSRQAIDAAKAMLAPADAKPAGGPAGLGGLGLAPKKTEAPKPLTPAQLAERKAAQARQAEALRQRQNQAKWGPPVSIKASCGSDVRVVIVPSMISHKDLMTTLQRKFPDQSAFTVRFTDADGASKPLNSRADFAAAFAAAQAAKAEGEEAKPTLHNLPVIKLSIVEHAAAAAAEGDAGAAEGDAGAAPLAPNEVVEIDEWILDFAALFREHLGVDAEAHLDLHAEVRRATRPSRSRCFFRTSRRSRVTPWRR